MAEVTYYVALPFVAGDDGAAAGEPTECFNPNAAVMRAEALSRKEGHVSAVRREAARYGELQRIFKSPVAMLTLRHLARMACTAGRSRVVPKQPRQPSGLKPCVRTNGPL
ncbi:MAG: hypothetical protein JWP25_1165 [Bradyrhizobium sp.]|nr:hypothetical protein [Bradyrhizobium sp.]